MYISPPSGYPTPEEFGRQVAGRRSADKFTADVCLPFGAAPLTLNDPGGRFSFTLSNASETEHAVPEAVLSAQVIFETQLRFPDERREIDELAHRWLGEVLNVLAFTTNRKFIPRALKRLVDWTPGLIDRDAMIYTETPEWDLAEPELNADYIDTAERILSMQASQEHQARPDRCDGTGLPSRKVFWSSSSRISGSHLKSSLRP